MPFLSPKHAAGLLELSVSRLQQLDREGRLTALRDSGNRRLYREADVMRFKAERERRRAEAQAAQRGVATP